MGVMLVLGTAACHFCRNHASPELAVNDQVLAKGQTSILIDPVQEDVHGSCLGDLVVVSIQPQHLLTPIILRFILSKQRTPIVPAEIQSNSRCEYQFSSFKYHIKGNFKRFYA